MCKTTGGRAGKRTGSLVSRLPKSEDKRSLLPGELKVLGSSVASTINELESASRSLS